MSISYRITFNGGDAMQLAAGINKQVLPMLHIAVKAVAEQTAKRWKDAVGSAKLWSGEKDAYTQSIKWEMTGDFSAYVSADYKHSGEIETGRSPRDLKRMLDTSMKVRRTEGGRRFLVIPFRHNTPGNSGHAGDMPPQIYDIVKAMTPSRVVAMSQRPSGEVTRMSPKTGMQPAPNQTPYLSNPKTKQAATVAARKYAWGDRLTAGQLKAAGFDTDQARRYAGMVKMDTSSGKQKSSAYMTFRVMMEGKPGWVIPAQPGLYLARNVSQQMQPIAEKAFAAAVKKTVGK